MKRLKIVADDKIPFLRGALEPVADVVYLPGGRIAREDLRDADALIIRTRTRCNRELLNGTPVRFIATATIGYDHIDRAYCDAAGIRWTSAPGCNAGSVRQYVVSALVNLAHNHHFDLTEKTLGVVGVGHVGTQVAAAARTLGMTVLLCDPPRQDRGDAEPFVSMDEILAKSDLVTLHVPLTRDGGYPTFHLADDDFFAHLRPGAIFLNAARGEVCSNPALKNALKTGQVAAAVLDVWENEPDIDRELLARTEYATPHIAGYSADGKANGTTMSVQAVSRFFGLGQDDWRVMAVPPPPEPEIVLPSGLAEAAALRLAVNRAYDLADDTRRLKAAPEQFEKQRGDYPLRREFGAFVVTGAVSPVLAELGFQSVKS